MLGRTMSDAERKAAAARLRHDLGKYVRWNAPEVREADAELLRARLALDLLETKRTFQGTLSAVEIYEAWAGENASLFTPRELDGLATRIGTLRELLPRLSALDAAPLVALDALTLEIAEATRQLHRVAAAPDGGR